MATLRLILSLIQIPYFSVRIKYRQCTSYSKNDDSVRAGSVALSYLALIGRYT